MLPSPEQAFYLSLVQSLHAIAERLERHSVASERGDIPAEKREDLLQFVQVTLATVEDALKSQHS